MTLGFGSEDALGIGDTRRENCQQNKNGDQIAHRCQANDQQFTDRRRNRALAANPASNEPGTSECEARGGGSVMARVDITRILSAQRLFN